MSLKILEDRIKNKQIGGVYLLFGEEVIDLNSYVEKIKKCFDKLENGVNLFVLDKSSVNTLSAVCESVSFFGEKKIIILKDTGLKFDTSILDDIDKNEITLVIIEKSVDKRISEYKYLSKNAVCVEFNPLSEKDAVMYVVRTLGAYGIKVSSSVSEYMVTSCSTDKSVLINEFRKIVAYLEKGSELTNDIIDKICVKTLDAKVFDMLDLAVNKKKVDALKKLNDLLSEQESPIGISIMLFKQIKQMYMIKLMEEKLKRTGENGNVAQMLGIHPFVYGKLKHACEKYTIEELKNLIMEFDEYDERSKLGEMDMENGLIRIVTIM